MHELIQNMVLSDVACFLGAAEKLDDNVMEHLIQHYIMTPLYHEPSETLPVIEKELQKGRYSRYNKLYFNIRKSGR